MEKAGNILKLFLDKHNLEIAKNYTSFFRSWSKLAGTDAAAHSKVVDIRKGTLIVEVDHPGWIQLLQMKYSEILKKIKKHYPELEIKRIHLVLQDAQSGGSKKETAEKTVNTPKKTAENYNDNLKSALEKLERSISEKARRDHSKAKNSGG